MTRHHLPQLGAEIFLTDGGMETTLIFHEGLDLPCFASFPLLRTEAGRAAMRRYYEGYLALAQARGLGFILEAPTWRANPDWGERLGYGPDDLAAANRAAVAFMAELRDAAAGYGPILVSGCIGPRGDGYVPAARMSPAVAAAYHAPQVAAFAAAGADLVTAMTLNYVEEAVGVARAAVAHAIPAVISFTLETDGRLPTGQTLGDAITAVDAATDKAPAYYMINCAHPSHFVDILPEDAPWLDRLRGLRANASTRSHAELDAAPDLDDGDPDALGRDYARLRRRLPGLTVLGGCCGTDHRHVAAICSACA